MEQPSKEITKPSDLKYHVYINLGGKCEINTNVKKLENLNCKPSIIIKRISCLVAMHLSDGKGFTQQTEYLLASEINRMLNFGATTAAVNGYTEFPMQDEFFMEPKVICRKECIKYFIDDETPFIISYDLRLVIRTFNEETSREFKVHSNVALVPILDDYLIEYFKDLQKQLSIQSFDLHVLSRFMGEDIKLYTYPPLIAKLTAALENQLKPDLKNVE